MTGCWNNEKEEWKLGYLAGIIDGEGTINIGRFRPREAGNYSYIPKVSFVNTYLELILTMQQEFGGLLYTGRPRLKREFYQLYWSGNKGKELLKLVLNKLIVKRKQAELYLNFPIGEGHTSPDLTNAEIALREVIYFKLKELNQKSIVTWVIGESHDCTNKD